MGTIADDKLAAFKAATGYNDGINRLERMYWLGKLAYPENAQLSLSDAKQLFLAGNNSISDDYHVWLATQPGGNIAGSIADREDKVF